MESGNAFNFIDGYNLNFAELKFRLSKMGLENIELIRDFGYIANLYNDIMNSRDIRFISKIKNILEEDKARPNFSDLLRRKRTRPPNSEKKQTNGFIQHNRREVDTSHNYKNSYSNSERKFSSDLLNKYPSEDKIVLSFLEKQENQPFVFSYNNGNVNYDEFLKGTNNDYIKSLEESNLKLRQTNKISLIKSNLIHKSESEQTIKNGISSAPNNKNLENPINKPLKDDVPNFTAPLSRRQSEKILINMNANNFTNPNNNPMINQTLRTPSNSNKNIIELPENNNNHYFNYHNQDPNNNIININSNSKNINLNPETNNYERRYSNNIMPKLNNLNDVNISSENRNSYSNNNILNLNKNNQKQNPVICQQNMIPQNERVFYSNNNIALVRKSMSLVSGDSALTKSDNNLNTIKSKSNPLLQYVTIGIKSNDEFKRTNPNADGKFSNNLSNRRPVKKVNNTNNIVNSFSIYASSAAENSKQIFEKGIVILKDNYKSLLALFLLLGGGVYVYKLYMEESSLFTNIYNTIKGLIPNDLSKNLEYLFNPDFIRDNVFTLCVLTAVLIAFIFFILKYREQTFYSKIAVDDYRLIKQILEASMYKEDNCDLIGLFENNIVKDNSERHKISEESYRSRIIPLMQEARIKDKLIEEGEILIQDQAQKVWRLRKDKIINTHHKVYNNVEM